MVGDYKSGGHGFLQAGSVLFFTNTVFCGNYF